MRDQGRMPERCAGAGRECSLEEKVAWLASRAGPGDEAIETHFAWVFLTGDRAWKLRKPVRRDAMDYGTLEARLVNSEEEVRLNRRLAPSVYLGVRALTCDTAGRLAIGGNGAIVDWLVEMRRLDRNRMLDVLLAAGRVTDRDLDRIASRLADFYAGEPPAVLDGTALAARLEAQVRANHAVLVPLDAPTADALQRRQLEFLAGHREWFEQRASRGCVIEAHGDLRPEHILLDEPPVVIDCLEFDRQLRVMDRAEELAFLELECGRIGAPQAGRHIARACLARLDDAPPVELSRFYRSHRAATRAKLYGWRASEPDGPPQQWLATMRAYLGLAREAAMGSLPASEA
jgi:aminoglycoside phosphotransferase family enzyme